MTFQKSLKETLKKVRRRIPLTQLYKKFAVVQVFINDGEKTTRYGISNFPSFFEPDNAKSCFCHASLFDEHGIRIFKTKLKMKPFETLQVDFLQLLGKTKAPERGLAVFNIVPDDGLFFAYPNLDRLTSHFFSMYQDKAGSVCGLIHPQSLFKAEPKPELHWESNLKIEAADLEWIEMYQINPGTSPVHSNFILFNEKGERLYSKAATLNPFGIRHQRIPRESFAKAEQIHVGLEGATGENCKPILFFKTKNSSVSAVHS